MTNSSTLSWTAAFPTTIRKYGHEGDLIIENTDLAPRTLSFNYRKHRLSPKSGTTPSSSCSLSTPERTLSQYSSRTSFGSYSGPDPEIKPNRLSTSQNRRSSTSLRHEVVITDVKKRFRSASSPSLPVFPVPPPPEFQKRRTRSFSEKEGLPIEYEIFESQEVRRSDLRHLPNRAGSSEIINEDDASRDPQDISDHVPPVTESQNNLQSAAEKLHDNVAPSERISILNTENSPEPCVTTIAPKPRPDATDQQLLTAGKRRVTIQKHSMQITQATINGFCIFVTWWWMQYFYILLPFITATVCVNCIMIASLGVRLVKTKIRPTYKSMPESPERIVMLIPCYNETKDEIRKSLDSLVAQTGIESHSKAIMIVCDGQVRGPGMEKTTAEYLMQDILIDSPESEYFPKAYLAWDQQYMDIACKSGTYGGIPYLCIVKKQNQGKRDSLILIRSFLYNFNIRHTKPTVIMSNSLFVRMTSFLETSGLSSVDSLIGMDADTVFEDDCVKTLVDESHYPNTVGVCGYVLVDFSAGRWSAWRLYQSAEYTIAQALRRLHQSVVTGKVSCLPGCCQLLKICEETCGNEVLIDKFGYCPTIKDGLLTHIRATASEDRNHVCHMLSARPKVYTRQALKARAVTDVPSTWSVFLSQRRRWTLGATSNDLLLMFAPGVQWFERCLATINVFTWFLNLFILASFASFIYATLCKSYQELQWTKC